MKMTHRAACGRGSVTAVKPARMKVLARSAGAGLVALLWQASASAAVGWSAEASMNTARGQHAAALMDDGSVGVFGGINSSGFVQGSERYSDGAWVSIGSPGITGNVTEAVTLGTGHVLMRTDGSLNARLYDPVANTWLVGGALTAQRSQPSMTLLPSGKVLVAGGSSLSSAELYDPETRTWTPTGSMAQARSAHAAVLLRDGRVLVVSGVNSGGAVAGAEIYDPDAGLWSVVAPPLYARRYASLVLLPDGRVLLSGGETDIEVTAEAEIFDVQANVWTATGTMNSPREGAMGSPLGHGTALPSGMVLVAGGLDDTGVAPVSAELYDRSIGLWADAGSMGTGRENGTANLLPNGDVLLTGGLTRDPSVTFYAFTERYTSEIPPGPVPLVDALPLLQRASSALTLTGSGFTGGSGVSTPQLQLQRAENGAITTLVPASYTGTTFTSPVLATMPAGLYMARMIVDGVPSAGRLIRFTDPVGTPSGIPGNAQVAVSWILPANTGGNPPDGYVVTASPGGEGCTAAAPATSCTVAGLDNGTPYTFTVRAQHPNGLGPPATTLAAITPTGGAAPRPPVAVPGLTPVGAALVTLMAAVMAGWARRRRPGGHRHSRVKPARDR